MRCDVQIEMASRKTTAHENFDEIKKAVEHAAHGLYANYGVEIQSIQVIDEKVIMKLSIPDAIADNFSIGNHMRGVAAYLMKFHKEQFEKYLIGRRLLYYTVIPTPTDATEYLSVTDKLNALTKFAELLKYNDTKSKERISQIISILYKED